MTNPPPTATFGFTPAQPKLNQVVTFDAAGSTDTAPGTITKYEWDLDGNGTYETNRGTVKTATKTYTAEGPVDVRLKVTDNGGATDFTTRTVDGRGQPAADGLLHGDAQPGHGRRHRRVQRRGVDRSRRHDRQVRVGPRRQRHATRPTRARPRRPRRVYTRRALVTVGLRVTDNGGKTATTTVVLDVRPAGASNYGDAVLDTPGLQALLAHGRGGRPDAAPTPRARARPTLTGGARRTGRRPRGRDEQGDRASTARATSRKADVDLSGTPTSTVEFWLKWDRYTNDDALALEFTRNFNQYDGGFIVDPNAASGSFAVSIGRGAAQQRVLHAAERRRLAPLRLRALDTAAPAATEITPYVDGVAVSYTKPV